MRIYPKTVCRVVMTGVLCCFVVHISYQRGRSTLWSTENAPWEPVYDLRHINLTQKYPTNDTVLVVVLAYQRSGSSFLGEIFNQNPDAFEWYEPLDGVYSALYGTKYGYNVPADIWNYWNGTERKLPTYEIEAVAQVSTDILTCNLENLPSEVLLHTFVEMFSFAHLRLRSYQQCLRQTKSKTFRSCENCNSQLSRYCGLRFGQNEVRQKQCLRLLATHSFPTADWAQNLVKTLPQATDFQVITAVNKYKICMTKCREKALTCLPHLKPFCESAPLRAIKPVRLPMDGAQRILEMLPQTKIVYNLRDPRGVVQSRHNTSASFQAVYAGASITRPISSKQKPDNSKHDIIREAKLFCGNAKSHLHKFHELLAGHPDSLKQVIYEKYAAQPTETAEEIYEFLGLPVPYGVVDWLQNNTREESKKQTTRNAVVAASHWKKDLTTEQQQAITAICEDVIHTVDHKGFWV